MYLGKDFLLKAGLNLNFDSKRHFLFSSKYDTLGLEERYGRCFKSQFYLFLCLRRVLSKPLQKWLWLPWQRDVAFFSFTPVAIPEVHPITKNPKAIPRGSYTTSYMRSICSEALGSRVESCRAVSQQWRERNRG